MGQGTIRQKYGMIPLYDGGAAYFTALFDAHETSQVCLAAETCGHVDFNIRRDVWYSSEPFHCGSVAKGAAAVTFWQIYRKVGQGLC